MDNYKNTAFAGAGVILNKWILSSQSIIREFIVHFSRHFAVNLHMYGIICEFDRLSHGSNQTIIEQFHGDLTAGHKINESAWALYNNYLKFVRRVTWLNRSKHWWMCFVILNEQKGQV